MEVNKKTPFFCECGFQKLCIDFTHMNESNKSESKINVKEIA